MNHKEHQVTSHKDHKEKSGHVKFFAKHFMLVLMDFRFLSATRRGMTSVGGALAAYGGLEYSAILLGRLSERIPVQFIKFDHVGTWTLLMCVLEIFRKRMTTREK